MAEANAKNGNLTLDELYAAANEMCRRNWGVEFTGRVEFVPRYWRSYMAVYDSERHTVQFSAKTNAELMRLEVLDNLLHELVHWRLHTTGQPFDDLDDEFIAECCKVGASLSGTKAAKEAYLMFEQRRLIEERRASRLRKEAVS